MAHTVCLSSATTPPYLILKPSPPTNFVATSAPSQRLGSLAYSNLVILAREAHYPTDKNGVYRWGYSRDLVHWVEWDVHVDFLGGAYCCTNSLFWHTHATNKIIWYSPAKPSFPATVPASGAVYSNPLRRFESLHNPRQTAWNGVVNEWPHWSVWHLQQWNASKQEMEWFPRDEPVGFWRCKIIRQSDIFPTVVSYHPVRFVVNDGTAAKPVWSTQMFTRAILRWPYPVSRPFRGFYHAEFSKNLKTWYQRDNQSTIEISVGTNGFATNYFYFTGYYSTTGWVHTAPSPHHFIRLVPPIPVFSTIPSSP